MKAESNILVIDNNDNNQSITYHKSVTNNTAEIYPDIDELIEIFLENYNDIFKYNTKNALLFILSNGKEIPLNRFSGKYFPKFIKIIDKELQESDNQIIISCEKDHLIPNNSFPFNQYETLIYEDNRYGKKKYVIYGKYDPIQYIDGYKNTVDAMKILRTDDKCAISYCYKQQIILSNNDIYQGYLPATGQLRTLYKYERILNYIFKCLNINSINMQSENWWSSSEIDTGNAWYNYNNCNFIGQKSYQWKVLPFFKKISKNDF